MRSRFGIPGRLEFYSPQALHEILRQNVKLLKLHSEDDALWELARRSRGTPRIANRCCGGFAILRRWKGMGKSIWA